VQKHPSKCGFRSAVCTAVDEAFWAILCEICKSPKTLKAYLQATQPKPSANANAKREAKIKKIKAERKSVMLWFSQQLLTHEEATERLEALKKAENKLLQENITTQAKSPRMDAEKVCKAVADCNISLESRRSIVRKLIDKVVFKRTDNRCRVQYYKLDMQVFFK
jgi:hypothetical protein